VLTLASTRYDLVQRINWEVNSNTIYKTDAEKYFTPEFWEAADGEGDCEDYALAKRNRLLALGVPLQDLRLCVVFTETEEGQRRLRLKRAGVMETEGDHAVLVVRDSRSDWILDNRFAQPMALSDTPYVIDRIQIAGTHDWEHGS
jgi:predicted transglutaminase-like cysteine proteinase